MDTQPTPLDEQAIAEFLTRHPNFFNDFPTLLAELNIPHPHGTHAVSMSERQLIAMRDMEGMQGLVRKRSVNDGCRSRT